LDADLEEVRESASTEAREVDRPAPPADDDVADVADDSLADLRPIRLVPPTIEPTVVAPVARSPIAPAASPSTAVPAAPAAHVPPPPGPSPARGSRPSPLMSRRIPSSPPSTAELPLFVRGLPVSGDDDRSDAPMVAVPSQPRAPLAVQLRAPEAPRSTSPHRPGRFDEDLLEDLRRIEKIERSEAASRARAIGGASPTDAAGVLARIQSALVDAALLAVIAATIVWLTVKFSGLTVNQVRLVPMLPLAGFLLLVTFGYLFLFTAAGGQTVGKMLIGLRVVPDDAPGTRANVQQAVLRSLVALPSALAAGLGFVPALFGGRALHDRASGTRVVGA
ncbi:MAG TPA: RDD family protein, partial [Vicinamibacterales bacterium]|nr:RDD family protein [Vicinamibacterales bacterium]